MSSHSTRVRGPKHAAAGVVPPVAITWYPMSVLPVTVDEYAVHAELYRICIQGREFNVSPLYVSVRVVVELVDLSRVQFPDDDEIKGTSIGTLLFLKKFKVTENEDPAGV